MFMLFARLHLALIGAVRGTALTLSARRGPARGITFVEYALLGAIAVILGYLFRSRLSTMFDGLLDSIEDALDV